MIENVEKTIEKLISRQMPSREELIYLIGANTSESVCQGGEGNRCEENSSLDNWSERLRRAAVEERKRVYGTDVYIRGLIEFTNYCKNDCLYCGLRRGNVQSERYRLADEEIMECCRRGYKLGFRTFVLQGGEDTHFSDERLCRLVEGIKAEFPDCAITLSVGERSRESYQRLYDAGAERYLLRHETADVGHYARLHPKEMSLENRKNCLFELKDIGYQVGSGFMVGSPFQKPENLADDLLFLKQLEPQMIGIGPFIPNAQTPFAEMSAGSVELTLRLISVLRLMFPHALIPSTTALASLKPEATALDGRRRGILAGANVVMPNLSPSDARAKYAIYDNKASFGAESAEGLEQLKQTMAAIGYRVVVSRGDYIEECAK